MNTSTQSVIYRHSSDINEGIRTFRYERNAIGYVEQGVKLVHRADNYLTVRAGELFHLPGGIHYIENIPDEQGRPFRQTIFFYSPSDLRNGFNDPAAATRALHLCDQCSHTAELYTYPAWPMVRDFFRTINKYVEIRAHLDNPELGHLKLCELVQLLLTQPGCCISRPVFMSVLRGPHSLSEIVRENVFTGVGLEELASLCGLSLSSFKLEFQRHFHTSPHRWLNEQRLSYARLQLITADRSVASIAAECRFQNPSHFIKLFRERFGTTPAIYRRNYGHGPAE